MASNIVRAVDDGIEFFTEIETGESGMSISGVARLCGVSKQAVSKLLKDLSTKAPSKWLEPFAGKALDLSIKSEKKGGKVQILRADVCAALIFHYAFTGNETAMFAMSKFASAGVNTWIQSITGWTQKAADTTRYLTGVVLIEPKQWEMHFSDEWAAEASRLTGWSWNWSVMGTFINQAVYDWMPQEVREELEKVNPVGQSGKRPNKQHQHFSDEAKPILKAHITEVLTLMKASESVPAFHELMNRRWKGRYQLRLNIGNAA